MTHKIGAQGEYLVCANIRREGFISFLAAPDCAYDIVLDSGACLLRVQVKTTLRSRLPNKNTNRHPVYVFDLTLNRSSGPHAFYRDGEYDLLALVALDISKIAYILPVERQYSLVVRPDTGEHMSYPGSRCFKDLTLGKVLAELGVAA